MAGRCYVGPSTDGTRLKTLNLRLRRYALLGSSDSLRYYQTPSKHYKTLQTDQQALYGYSCGKLHSHGHLFDCADHKKPPFLTFPNFIQGFSYYLRLLKYFLQRAERLCNVNVEPFRNDAAGQRGQHNCEPL